MMKSELVEIDEGIHASIVEVAVHASMVGLKLPEKSYLRFYVMVGIKRAEK